MLFRSGVIFSAAYMLWMIQRVFYGSLGLRPEEVSGWDISAREHVELWPLAVLFLVMGIFSPYWTRAIDSYSAQVAREVWLSSCYPPHHCRFEVRTTLRDKNGVEQPLSPVQPPNGFVDPNLGAAALGKQAPATNKGARY